MPVVIPPAVSATSTLQTPTTVQVFDYEYGPAGKPLPNFTVTATLQHDLAQLQSPLLNLDPQPVTSTVTDTNGYWTMNLVPNVNLTPANTVYTIETPWRSYQISVPNVGAPFQSSTLIVTAPAALAPATINIGPLTTGSLIVTGTATLQGPVTAQNGLTVSAGLNAAGSARFAGPDPWYDVTHPSFGATGNGVTDDRIAIQAALTAARQAGGGIVYLPPGTYLVSSVVNSIDASFNTCLVVGAKTTVLGAGRDATTLKLANSQSGANNVVLVNFNILAGGDQQITLQDFSVDGNAVNQSPTGLNGGIDIRRARGVRHLRVRSFNHWGTDVGAHESSAFSSEWSTDISYVDCEVPQTTANTSAGYAASYCTNVKYVNCIAFGSGHGHGFTAFHTRQMQYVNCHAYLNGDGVLFTGGFDEEFCDDVIYAGCVSGGLSADQQGGQNPNFPFANAVTLGNSGHGFIINNGSRVQLIGCAAVGQQSSGSGVRVNGLAANAGCKVVGGDFSDNGGFGVFTSDAGSSQNLRITGGPRLINNTLGAMQLNAVNYASAFGAITANAPSVPATTVALTNPFPFDVALFIVPGASTCAVSIGGNATGVTLASSGVGQMFRLPAGQTVTLTYTSAPTWNWFLD